MIQPPHSEPRLTFDRLTDADRPRNNYFRVTEVHRPGSDYEKAHLFLVDVIAFDDLDPEDTERAFYAASRAAMNLPARRIVLYKPVRLDGPWRNLRVMGQVREDSRERSVA